MRILPATLITATLLATTARAQSWPQPIPPSPLATTPGTALSLRGGYTRYAEPGVTISGGQIGGEFDQTYTLLPHTWLRGELNGWIAPDQRYKGSTLIGGTPLTGTKIDTKGEARLLIGFDLPMGPVFTLAPFGGYGVRDLYDSAGDFNGAASGYTRNNLLQYLLAGADARFTSAPGYNWEWRNEAESVLTGTQSSDLSDAGGNDITTHQKNGWGYRTHFALLGSALDCGLYYEHWHLDASDSAYSGPTYGYLYEPANHTDEVGLFFRHRF